MQDRTFEACDDRGLSLRHRASRRVASCRRVIPMECGIAPQYRARGTAARRGDITRNMGSPQNNHERNRRSSSWRYGVMRNMGIASEQPREEPPLIEVTGWRHADHGIASEPSPRSESPPRASHPCWDVRGRGRYAQRQRADHVHGGGRAVLDRSRGNVM